MPTLDLLKRTESGGPLTVGQFDANYLLIEEAVNAKVDLSDSRLTNARTPTAHTHPNSDLPELAGALAAKASQTALAALQAQVDGFVAGSGFVSDSDVRLTNARAIANGNYTLFSVTSGVAALAADSVGPTHLADGGYGVITFAGTTFSFNGRVINPAQMADGSHGAFSYTSGVAALAANAVGTTAIANLAVTSGKLADSGVTTAKIADGNVTLAKLADADYGMISKVAGSFQIDAGVITPSMMSNGDFGVFTFASGVASLDNGTVAPAKLADADFGLWTTLSGASTINEVTSVSQYVAGTMNKPVTANLLQATYKPRIVSPVSGAVGFDAAGGLFVVIPEGGANLVHDNTPWANLPLDKEIDVWIKSGGTARTNTWSDPSGDLILPVTSLAPYNQTNTWKHFIYRWMPDTTTGTTKSKRAVIFAGLYA